MTAVVVLLVTDTWLLLTEAPITSSEERQYREVRVFYSTIIIYGFTVYLRQCFVFACLLLGCHVDLQIGMGGAKYAHANTKHKPRPLLLKGAWFPVIQMLLIRQCLGGIKKLFTGRENILIMSHNLTASLSHPHSLPPTPPHPHSSSVCLHHESIHSGPWESVH